MEATVADAALAWLSFDNKARFMINGDRHVLWHNEQALHILSMVSDVRVLDGALSLPPAFNVPDPVIDASRPRKDDGCRGGVRAWTLKTAEDRLIWFFAYDIVVGEGLLTAVEMHVDDVSASPKYALFCQECGLTAAEMAILQGFLDGSSPQQIASSRRVGIDTIRAQIRTLYQKMGVSSREQMFKKIGPFLH